MLNFTYLTLFASFAGINQQVQRVRFYLLNSQLAKAKRVPPQTYNVNRQDYY
jgi:hypothetical protein